MNSKRDGKRRQRNPNREVPAAGSTKRDLSFHSYEKRTDEIVLSVAVYGMSGWYIKAIPTGNQNTEYSAMLNSPL